MPIFPGMSESNRLQAIHPEETAMTNSRRAVLPAAVLPLLVGLAFAGCSRQSLLPEAYYAEQMIPIYPHAQLADQMGSNSFGDEPGEAWDGMVWWLKSKDDPDRIVAFYQAKLPGWQKETGEDGAVTFKTMPPDGDDGEEVYVRIEIDGRIQIGESVKASRRSHKQT